MLTCSRFGAPLEMRIERHAIRTPVECDACREHGKQSPTRKAPSITPRACRSVNGSVGTVRAIIRANALGEILIEAGGRVRRHGMCAPQRSMVTPGKEGDAPQAQGKLKA